MSESEYAGMVAEVDALLNDPGRRLDAARVWALLEAIEHYQVAAE